MTIINTFQDKGHKIGLTKSNTDQNYDNLKEQVDAATCTADDLWIRLLSHKHKQRIPLKILLLKKYKFKNTEIT